MSDPRWIPSSSSSRRAEAHAASSSSRDPSSSSSTPGTQRASSSSRTPLHPSTTPVAYADRVLSTPGSRADARQVERHRDSSRGHQQQSAYASPPSHPRFDDLVNTAVSSSRQPVLRPSRGTYDEYDYTLHQDGFRRQEQGSPSSRALRQDSSSRLSPSAHRVSPYERSVDSASPPGQSPSVPSGSISPGRQMSIGRRSAQSLQYSTTPDRDRQLDNLSVISSATAYSGPPTSVSSSSSEGWHERRPIIGIPASQTPPPAGSVSSSSTLYAYRPEVEEDIDMGDDDSQAPSTYITGSGRLSVQYPVSGLRGMDPGFGRRVGGIRSERATRHHTQSSRRASTSQSTNAPPSQPSESQPSQSGEGNASIMPDAERMPAAQQMAQFLPASRQYRVTPPIRGEQQGYATPSMEREQQSSRSQSARARLPLPLPETSAASSTPTPPPPPYTSEQDVGSAPHESSGVRSNSNRPRALIGPGVPSSPLSPTVARLSSYQELRPIEQRGGVTASSYPPPAPESSSTASRLTHSETRRAEQPRSTQSVPEIAVPQPGYPLQRPQISLERSQPPPPARQDALNTAEFAATRAIAVAALNAQERTASSAKPPSSLPIPEHESGGGSAERTSPKRRKPTPKENDDSAGKAKATKGKGDSPKRKARVSAGRKKSGESMKGHSSTASSSAQLAIDRQIQQLTIDIPSSFGQTSQGSAGSSYGTDFNSLQVILTPDVGDEGRGDRAGPSLSTPGEPGPSRASVSSLHASQRSSGLDDDDFMDEDTDDQDYSPGNNSKPKGKGKASARWDGDDRDYEFNVGNNTLSGGEREKREKIGIACSFCRTRKIKCDGGRPRCGRCMTRNDGGICEYAAEPKRRGRGKKTKEREARENAARERSKAGRPKKDLRKVASDPGAPPESANPASMPSGSPSSAAPALTIRVPSTHGQASSSDGSVGPPSTASAPPSAGPGLSSGIHRMRENFSLPPIQTSQISPPPNLMMDPALYALSLPMPAPAPSPVTSLPPLSDIFARAPSAPGSSRRHTPVAALSPLEAPGAPAWLRAPDEQFEFNMRPPATVPSFPGVAGPPSHLPAGSSRAGAMDRFASSRRYDDEMGEDDWEEFSSGDEYPVSDSRVKKRRKRHGATTASRRQSDRQDKPPPPVPGPSRS